MREKYSSLTAVSTLNRAVFGCKDLREIDFGRLRLEISPPSDPYRCTPKGGGEQLTTFRGIVVSVCSLSDEIKSWLDTVESTKKQIYSWSCGRGQKIYKLVTRSNPEDPKWRGITGPPDVIVITEYDVHGDRPVDEAKDGVGVGDGNGNEGGAPRERNLNYPPPLIYEGKIQFGDENDLWYNDRALSGDLSSSSSSSSSSSPSSSSSSSGEKTFSMAMCEKGYHSILIQGPGKDGSGKGIFLRSEMFDYEGGISVSGSKWDVIGCTETYQGGIGAVDLMEQSTNLDGSTKQWKASERRSVAIASVKFKNEDRRMVLVGAHLQTKSKDKEGRVKFPGEVRAGELETIKEM